MWDWNDNGGRPANIPPDEGSYITANELVRNYNAVMDYIRSYTLLRLHISPIDYCVLVIV